MSEIYGCTVIIPTIFWDNHLERHIRNIVNSGLYVTVIFDGVDQEVPKINNTQFIFNKDRMGPNVSRNVGIKSCKTTWLCFLDADDTLDYRLINLTLSRLAKEIKYNVIDFDIQFTDTRRILGDNCEIHSLDVKMSNLRDTFQKVAVGKLRGVSWGRLYKTNFLISNRIEFPRSREHGRDVLFSRLIAAHSAEWLKVDATLVYSFKRPNSFSREFNLENIKSAISLTEYDLNISIQYSDMLTIANMRHLKYIGILALFRAKSLSDYKLFISLLYERLQLIASCSFPKHRSAFLSMVVLFFLRRFTLLPWILVTALKPIYKPY